MTLEPGNVVGQYRLDQTIHRGRATTVFAATDTSLNRKVAFKVLTDAVAADPLVRERFVREAQVAASLDAHPNIVTVYTWGEIDTTLYYVTEFVAGISLGELVERQPGGEGIAVNEAIDLLEQIAGAIDFAHGRGAVHRDIKPANIMVRMTDTPRRAFLVDFGITKAVAPTTEHGDQPAVPPPPPGTSVPPPPVSTPVPPPPTHAPVPVSPLASGAFTGTPDYAAPEQIAGHHLDGRADVYALGCTAFEMLCGRPPFAESATDEERLAAHLHAEPPLISLLRTALPPGFDAVMSKVLAKQPDGRYRTCSAFVHALRDALPDQAAAYSRPVAPGADVPEPTFDEPDVQPARKLPWVIAAFLLVLALAAGGWVLTDGMRNPGVDVAVGRNVTIPTTTTTTTTSTTSTTTTSTTTTSTTPPPPPTNLYNQVIGRPLTDPGNSKEAAYVVLLQSRVFTDVSEVAVPGSVAHYYLEWARLVGPPSETAGPPVATEDGFMVNVGGNVELKEFVLDVNGKVSSFTECHSEGAVCHSIIDPRNGLVQYPPCQPGVDGCMSVVSRNETMTIEKLLDVALRLPRRSALYRIVPNVPPPPEGEEPPPARTVTAITNPQGSVRYIQDGGYLVLWFETEPQPETVDTLTVRYADGSSDELEIRYP